MTHRYLALILLYLLTLNVSAQTSKSAVAYCQRGFEEFQKGDLDAAIADFTTALKFDPSYARAYLNRALVWYRKGRLDEALKDFNKTVELKPDSADAYSGRGNVYIDRGDYQQAIADFSQAIAINPKHSGAYANRGIARQVNWQVDEAIADYTKAIELSPRLVEAFHNRGTAWLEKAEPGRAIIDFDRAIALAPRAASYNGRGKARETRGDLDGAFADYTKAIDLDTGYALAYANRASVLAIKGRIVEATKDFQMCLKLNRALGEFLRDKLSPRLRSENVGRSPTNVRP
jgi:Tfp pilus assembly protein PilF